MGTTQCVSSRTKIDIERYINNINTPLDKKIRDEYYHLKSKVKNKKSEENYSLHTTSNQKKLQRFKKWYKMTHHEIDYNDSHKKDNNLSFSSQTNNNFNKPKSKEIIFNTFSSELNLEKNAKSKINYNHNNYNTQNSFQKPRNKIYSRKK